MTAPGEDEGPGWKVSVGVGLVQFAPMSDERRALVAREAEKERLQAERDEEMRQQALVERRGELLMQGYRPRTQQELFQQVSFGQDRADAAERQREKAAAELLGQPKPRQRPPVWEIAAKQRELDDYEQTPATVARGHEVQGALASLKAKIYAATGRKLV
jgi:hypothetical protein